MWACDKTRGNTWAPVHWTCPPGARPGEYVVTVGDRKVGEVWKGRSGWLAISAAAPEHLIGIRGVGGFATRLAATMYVLDVGVRPQWGGDENIVDEVGCRDHTPHVPHDGCDGGGPARD